MSKQFFAVSVYLLLGLVRYSQAWLPTFSVDVQPPEFVVWTDLPGTAAADDSSDLQFPLQETNVEAVVAQGVLRARVTQLYKNEGHNCLQSRYIFPLPTRAAITNLTMYIGNRTVRGVIRTREAARQEFEQARNAGQSASLLDQERPNVFAMELANILPGESTRVEVEYVEVLRPVDGVYAFRFPALVGPRYGAAWAPGKDTSNLRVAVTLSVTPAAVGTDSDLPLQTTAKPGSTTMQTSGTNADVVLKFWFTGASVDATFLVAKHGGQDYFSLAIQPPQRRLLKPSQVSRREYLFILDVSGSMTGYPIDISKRLVTSLLKEHVRPGDAFNILLFAGGSQVLNTERNVDATSASVSEGLRWLDENMHAGGGTELLPALERAFQLPRQDTFCSRTIIIMTDGFVTVEREAFELVRENLQDGNVFVFGIGSNVNHHIIDGLARVGYGEPFIVSAREQAETVSAQLQRYIDSPVLSHVRLTFEGGLFQPTHMEPPSLPDVFASRPVQVVGKFSGALRGVMKLSGFLAGGSLFEYVVNLTEIDVSNHAAVPLLWARARIASISDFARADASPTSDSATKDQITDIGLSFSLMTEYTSFVAVDSDPSAPDVCRSAPTAPLPPDVVDKPSETERGMLMVASPQAESSSGSRRLPCYCAWLVGVVMLLKWPGDMQ